MYWKSPWSWVAIPWLPTSTRTLVCMVPFRGPVVQRISVWEKVVILQGIPAIVTLFPSWFELNPAKKSDTSFKHLSQEIYLIYLIHCTKCVLSWAIPNLYSEIWQIHSAGEISLSELLSFYRMLSAQIKVMIQWWKNSCTLGSLCNYFSNCISPKQRFIILLRVDCFSSTKSRTQASAWQISAHSTPVEVIILQLPRASRSRYIRSTEAVTHKPNTSIYNMNEYKLRNCQISFILKKPHLICLIQQ